MRDTNLLSDDAFASLARDAGIPAEDAEPELIDLPEPEPEELGEAAGCRGTECGHRGADPKCDDCAGREP